MLFTIDPVDLYYLGADNKVRHWHIEADDEGLTIRHGHHNGAMQTQFEPISKGKGGRSTFAQIKSRFDSRVNTQLLKGYKHTIADAMSGRTNALDLPKPMLAQSWDKVKNINFDDVFWQLKYDGNRCLITKRNGMLIAYSRKGKIITTINHILDSMNLNEGDIIDGELYHHGTPLNILRSWISKQQPMSESLRFHAYDVILPVKFSYRLEYLRDLALGDNAEVVPTERFEQGSLDELMTASRSEGYEGLILRPNIGGYEIGKRSRNLIKVKHFEDEEFTVTNIYRSEKGHPMATCKTLDGKTFDVVLPGSFEDKEEQVANADDFIGRELTVQFSQWTTDNIPFHAVAKCWHE